MHSRGLWELYWCKMSFSAGKVGGIVEPLLATVICNEEGLTAVRS